MPKKKQSRFTEPPKEASVCDQLVTDATASLQTCLKSCSDSSCQANCFGAANLELGNAYCGGCSSPTVSCCCSKVPGNCTAQCDEQYKDDNLKSCYSGCGVTA